jgi:hypothetical protein
MLKTKGFDQESMAKAHAKHFTGGPMAALRIILASDKSAGYEAQMDYPGLLETLRQQGEAVNAGDLSQAEAMLMDRASALQSVAARQKSIRAKRTFAGHGWRTAGHKSGGLRAPCCAWLPGCFAKWRREVRDLLRAMRVLIGSAE